ncbi:MAG: hypothetical protein QNJ65_23110 [Xenococcaceae cyanobacterium MO_234.B1]|nr:hypothetical protein [Xenococcaceae cyanobacterium MO_234.B1]
MMTSKKIIGILRRPLAEILQDLVQTIPSEMLKQRLRLRNNNNNDVVLQPVICYCT